MPTLPRKYALVFAFFALFVLAASALGQTTDQNPTISPDTRRGVELVKNGSFAEAILVLDKVTKNDQADADAWHYLGVAYRGINLNMLAMTAFYHAVHLRPSFAPSHLYLAWLKLLSDQLDTAESEAKAALAIDQKSGMGHYLLGAIAFCRNNSEAAVTETDLAIGLDPDLAVAYLLKYQVALEFALAKSGSPNFTSIERKRSKSKEAFDAMESYLRLEPDLTVRDFWRSQLAILHYYVDLLERTTTANPKQPQFASAVGQKAIITYKPAPAYTDEARDALEVGSVLIRMVLSADGTITNILVLKSLKFGLTQAAITTLKKLEFTPANKNGKPVSQITSIYCDFKMF